jgi:HAMP domain-containing protein
MVALLLAVLAALVVVDSAVPPLEELGHRDRAKMVARLVEALLRMSAAVAAAGQEQSGQMAPLQ